ncbi:MAG: M1 family peptidase, partial [Algoriphagus sp.]
MRFILATFCLLFCLSANAQMFPHGEKFTRQDTLRGTITPERAWWDLQYYHLEVKVDPETKSLSGKNTVRYKVLENASRMQIDLQAPMKLTKAEQGGEELEIEHEGNAHFITLKADQTIGEEKEVVLTFSGTPVEAVRPPWDGGLTWKTNSNGLPFIANSNQGLGASIWWPNKDHMYDEPDQGVLISVTVP